MKVAYNYATKTIDIEMELHEVKRTIYMAVFPMTREAYKFYRDKGVPRWLSVAWGIETAFYLVPGIQERFPHPKAFLQRLLGMILLYLYATLLHQPPFLFILLFMVGWAAKDFVREFRKGYSRAKSA